MKIGVVLVLFLSVSSAMGSEVLLVGRDGNSLAVSNQASGAWHVGDTACIRHHGRQIACGRVTKVKGRGAIVVLNFLKGKIAKGDEVVEVPPLAPPLAAEPRSEADERSSFSVSAAALASPSYVVPAAGFSVRLVPEIAIGAQAGYLGASTTDVSGSGIPLYFTLDYFALGDFEGFWARAAAGLYLWSFSGLGLSETPTSIAAYLTAGYRFAISRHWCLGVAGGVQYLPRPTSQLVYLPYGALQPVALVDIGFRF